MCGVGQLLLQQSCQCSCKVQVVFFSLLDILILLLLKLFIIVHIFLLPKFGNITLDLVRVKPHTDPCVNNLSVQDLRECHI